MRSLKSIFGISVIVGMTLVGGLEGKVLPLSEPTQKSVEIRVQEYLQEKYQPDSSSALFDKLVTIKRSRVLSFLDEYIHAEEEKQLSTTDPMLRKYYQHTAREGWWIADYLDWRLITTTELDTIKTFFEKRVDKNGEQISLPTKILLPEYVHRPDDMLTPDSKWVQVGSQISIDSVFVKVRMELKDYPYLGVDTGKHEIYDLRYFIRKTDPQNNIKATIWGDDIFFFGVGETVSEFKVPLSIPVEKLFFLSRKYDY